MADQYSGGCFCGAVEIEVSGRPALAGFCHCIDCARWAAAPVLAFNLWRPEDVTIKKGDENIATFNKTEKSYRKFCKKCGGHLMIDHPKMKLIDVYANVLDGFNQEPKLHVYYGEGILKIKDGLPKYKDLPEHAGGSGETLPE